MLVCHPYSSARPGIQSDHSRIRSLKMRCNPSVSRKLRVKGPESHTLMLVVETISAIACPATLTDVFPCDGAGVIKTDNDCGRLDLGQRIQIRGRRGQEDRAGLGRIFLSKVTRRNADDQGHTSVHLSRLSLVSAPMGIDLSFPARRIIFSI
jgi:hypothetical protein